MNMMNHEWHYEIGYQGERNMESGHKGKEQDLVKLLEVTSSIGYGKTRKQIKAVVEKIACEKSVLRKQRISDGWFRRFLEW